jgi:hypothetical protein
MASSPSPQRVKEEQIYFSSKNVEIHPPVLPSYMKLILLEDNVGSHAVLLVPGFKDYQVRSWLYGQNKEMVEQEFQGMAEQLRRGQYRLHIYGDGEVRLELQ